VNIVFLDSKTVGETSFGGFEKLGKLVCYETTNHSDTADRIADADVVVTNKVVIGKNELEGAKNLKLICVAATGTNNIDLEACKSAGVAVYNVAGYSTSSVVQVTFASILSFVTKIGYFDGYVKSGEYAKSEIFTCMDEEFAEIAGKKYCVVGLGNIGKGIYGVASAFGCDVSYYSTSGANESQGYERVDFEGMLGCDIISVHCGLNDKTRGLFGEESIARMKPSAILANFGRGGIVDETAVARAIDEGRLGGYITDVFEKEPILSDSPLQTLKNRDRVLFTPHIAWASREARARLIGECVQNIKAFVDGVDRNRLA